MIHSLLLPVLALVSFPGGAKAQKVVAIPQPTTSATAPVDAVHVQNPVPPDSSYICYNYPSGTPARRDVGQTFSVDSARKLTGLTIYVNSESSPANGAEIALTIHKLPNGTSGTPTGTIVTATTTLPSSMANVYLTFDLSSANVFLAPGQQYGFQLSFKQPASNRVISLGATSGTAAYPNGRVYTYDGTTYSAIGTDLAFVIHSAIVISSPVPTTSVPAASVQVTKRITPGNSYSWYNYPTGSPARRDVGQTFLTDSTFKVTGVTVYVNSASSVATGAAVSLRVHTFASGTGGTPTSTLLRATTTFPASSTSRYLTFDLSRADLVLQAGQYYGFQLSFDTPATNRVVSLGSSPSPSTYPSGTVYTYSGTGYAAIGTDLTFYIQSVTDYSNAICVRNYGAVGDGVTDDTVAIQNALNAARSARKSVQVNTMQGWYGNGNWDGAYPLVIFDPGTYKITNTLVGYREMYLRGHGAATIKQTDPNKDLFYQHEAFRTTIENLRFDGGKMQVRIFTKNQNASKVLITGCQFNNSSSEAVSCRIYTSGTNLAVAPYQVTTGSNGYHTLGAEIDVSGMAEGYSSTLMVVSDCDFNNCIRAFDISTDGSVVEDCNIVANPQTSGCIMRCGTKIDLKRLVCTATSSANSQHWIEARGHTLTCRDSIFDSTNGMCLVRAIRPPGYISTDIMIDNNDVNSAGCPEGGIVSLEVIPNALYVLNNQELSSGTASAVGWVIDSGTATFTQQRYFSLIPLDTQFNFCVDGNSTNIDSSLPETAQTYIRPNISGTLLSALSVDTSGLSNDYSPVLLNTVLATNYGVVGNGTTDDAAALQAAVDAAAGLPGSAVILPPKLMKTGTTIWLPAGTRLIGNGYAFLKGTGSFAAVAVSGAGEVLVKNVGFENFTKGVDITTAASDVSHTQLYNCNFFDCFETAVSCLSGSAGTNSTTLDCKNGINITTAFVVTNAATNRLSNFWMQGNYFTDSQAYMENHYGSMYVESMLGVPQNKKGQSLYNSITQETKIWDKGNELRWFDNYGKLVSMDNRFGGETGGACPVYNRAANTTFFFEGGQFSANGPYANRCYSYLEELPTASALMMTGNIPAPEEQWVWGRPQGSQGTPNMFVSGPGVDLLVP